MSDRNLATESMGGGWSLTARGQEMFNGLCDLDVVDAAS